MGYRFAAQCRTRVPLHFSWKEKSVDEQELQGRLNALTMTVEIALIEVFTLKHGSISKALDVIRVQLGGLAESFEKDLPSSTFRKGNIDELNLIVNRLEGIFRPKAK